MLLQTAHNTHVGIIHFQNGELNLLSVEFIDELNKALDVFEQDDATHIILLTSERKAFCAGANLKELVATIEGEQKQKQEGRVDPIQHWQRLSQMQKPVIACVTGACLGGGLEMALMCDFIVASEKATFGFPEIKLGLLPGGGGTQRILDRLSLARARELIMFGDSITVETAYDWGLVNKVYANDTCFESALKFAEMLAERSLDSLKAIKKLMSLSKDETLEQRLGIERAIFYERLQSSEARATIQAFFDRKK